MKANRHKTNGMHELDIINPLKNANSLIIPRIKILNVHNFTSLSLFRFFRGSLGSPLSCALKQLVQAVFFLSLPDVELESLIECKNSVHTELGNVDYKFNNFKLGRQCHEAEHWKLILASHDTNKYNYFSTE